MPKCKKCRESIDVEAIKCPYCGHTSRSNKAQKVETRVRLMLVLVVLTAGAALPIALPLWWWWGRKSKKLKEQNEWSDIHTY